MYNIQPLLPLISSMKTAIENGNEPDGAYSVQKFLETKEIEYPTALTETVYVRDSKHGDFVTVQDTCRNDTRTIVWTERIADPETNSFADTKNLPDIMRSGECICLVKNISLNDFTEHFVADSYVTIPEGYLGIVKQPSNSQQGLIVIVPALI